MRRSFREGVRDRSTNSLILLCIAALFVLILLSYFYMPKYEKGVWIGLAAFSNALTGLLSFKFGITVPGSRVEKSLEEQSDENPENPSPSDSKT